MSDRLISDPYALTAQELLHAIESTKDAFTTGRRNNDMVNWYVAKRLVDMEMSSTFQTLGSFIERYQQDFSTMLLGLREIQQLDMKSWETGWAWKIQVLHEHYFNYDTDQLRMLWLPMLYDDGTDPNQLTLTGSSEEVS